MIISAKIISRIKLADKESLMYISRHAERTVAKLSKMFGAILVAGPRQVGKTTMLDQITNGLNRATLDDPIMRAAAEEQSGTFFLDNPPPVFVDEILSSVISSVLFAIQIHTIFSEYPKIFLFCPLLPRKLLPR